jgi:ELWxxDGT repeat protein
MLHRESGARRRRFRIGAPLAGSVLIIVLFVGYLIAAGQSSWDGIARMVRDIRPGELGSSPNDFVEAGGKLFFVADDGSYGTELWTSDGTSAGTQRLTDIAPSAAGASFTYLTNAQGTLYFIAQTNARVLQLWRSDGTRAGTRRVKVFDPGADVLQVRELTAVGTTVYFGMTRFEGTDRIEHSSLWRSDGSEQGTIVVADIAAQHLNDVQWCRALENWWNANQYRNGCRYQSRPDRLVSATADECERDTVLCGRRWQL